MSEEELDPCTASAKLIARRASGSPSSGRGGDAVLGPALEKTPGWPLLLAGSGRMGEQPVARTAGQYCRLGGMAVPDVAAGG